MKEKKVDSIQLKYETVDEIFMMWIAETPATDDSGQCTLEWMQA